MSIPYAELSGCGMGGSPDSIYLTMGVPEGALSPPNMPVPAPRDPARQVYAELQRAIGAASRGRIDAAISFATNGVNFFMRNVPAQDRGVWENYRAAVMAYIGRSRGGAGERLASQESAEAKHKAGVIAWDTTSGGAALSRSEAEIAAAQQGILYQAANIVAPAATTTSRRTGATAPRPRPTGSSAALAEARERLRSPSLHVQSRPAVTMPAQPQLVGSRVTLPFSPARRAGLVAEAGAPSWVVPVVSVAAVLSVALVSAGWLRR